ncbi:MAG: 3-deoxy-8-phosphooctulonate synthase [Candidatus Omnitrophica bacterium]|nr:3-deoxy-8-phosphooctulonate synthase [Candidatus Omnitrophota bacterium]
MHKTLEQIFYLTQTRKKKRKKSLFLIAGPCVIESQRMCLENAAKIKQVCDKLDLPFIFKASYDKANRTSVNSFRGVGIKEGLAIIRKVKYELGVPVTSDVHTVLQIKQAKDVLDILQIPALLSRQTDLLTCAAATGKFVNIKKGQFMAPEDIVNAIRKVEKCGNKKILVTERGTCFGYHNLVSDLRAIPIMQDFGYPVIFDATHSVQLPSAGSGKSLGQRRFVEPLALAAIAAGCNGLFLEVHKQPGKARCDGPNMINFTQLEELLKKANKIFGIINE